ncbi:hypothetical protein EMA8858_02024 [Emticicia aquatica]|uniref:DUF1361 domain-containing protein n=1 Tax=Emticicia aquatica TaxID=1681835 RepID=A0ABN8ETD0_9BACT|nr:DUF1361 domain-containing protein [Emticicia aquatica]CAH0995896.1 hypothetical protein EMA8858_02024 [Emticicia aquatica]
MQSNQIRLTFSISRATLSLVLLSSLCCFLLLVRTIETRHLRGIYLLWNLFLAWMPLFFALIARRISIQKSKKGIYNQFFILINLGLWLLFFPNAPYIITDLIHLGEFNGQIVWFDTVSFLW